MAELDGLTKINEKLGKLIELGVDERNYSERIAVALEALLDEQIITNVYKEQQKQGDIRSRKRSECYSKFGILIALAAVYISITGLDGRVARFFTSLMGVL